MPLSIYIMEIFPPSWPLAKMTLALKFCVQRLDRLIAGYLMDVIATHQDPDQCRKSTSAFAKALTVTVATYLAKLIAFLLRPVLYHPHMIQFDDDTEPLLTSQFWVRPVCEELLHASSRFNMPPAAECKRPTSNLVKVASHPRAESQSSANMHPLHAPITEWIGAECPVDSLNIWFPAHWGPIVLHELQRREDRYRRAHSLWFDAPSHASDSNKLVRDRAGAIQSRNLHHHMGKMDRDGDIPTITGRLKVDWTDFPVEDILEQLTTLKEGILRGVFRQKAAAAWFGCRAEKAQVTALLPGQLDVYSWLEKIDNMSHSWPKSGIFGKLQGEDLEARTFHLHRKFTRARHLWLSLRPDWNLMRTHMYTDWPYAQLHDRLFANPGRNDRINDTPSQNGYHSPAYQDWQQQGLYMAQFLGYESQ